MQLIYTHKYTQALTEWACRNEEQQLLRNEADISAYI